MADVSREVLLAPSPGMADVSREAPLAPPGHGRCLKRSAVVWIPCRGLHYGNTSAYADTSGYDRWAPLSERIQGGDVS